MSRKAFWIVWNPNGGAPTRKHESLESAQFEADRLARKHKGETFVVLQSISGSVVRDIHRVDLRPVEPPF